MGGGGGEVGGGRLAATVWQLWRDGRGAAGGCDFYQKCHGILDQGQLLVYREGVEPFAAISERGRILSAAARLSGWLWHPADHNPTDLWGRPTKLIVLERLLPRVQRLSCWG